MSAHNIAKRNERLDMALPRSATLDDDRGEITVGEIYIGENYIVEICGGTDHPGYLSV